MLDLEQVGSLELMGKAPEEVDNLEEEGLDNLEEEGLDNLEEEGLDNLDGVELGSPEGAELGSPEGVAVAVHIQVLVDLFNDIIIILHMCECTRHRYECPISSCVSGLFHNILLMINLLGYCNT